MLLEKITDENFRLDLVEDISATAICPYCGVDSIIGKSSGYPITKEFLRKMHNYSF